MYKVITHTIVEEHFTHPSTAGHALMSNIKPKMSSTVSTEAVISYDTPAASTFKNLVRSLLETYVADVRSGIVSIMGTGEDTGVIENKVVQTIGEIGTKIFKPYYNADVSDRIEQHLKAYTIALMDYAKAEKGGRSTGEAENSLTQHIGDIATVLNTVNMMWTREKMNEYYTWFAQDAKDQVKSRKTKNWTADQAAYDHARGVFLSGIVNEMQGYAHVLAKGVIAQHADRFR